MDTNDERWTLPEWMEPYRDVIESDLGGNTIEDLLNDKTTNGFNNTIRSALICMGESKVNMLTRLRKLDALNAR